MKQLQSLDPKKSVGLDGISPRFLRDGAIAITEPISHIINFSITTEIVPDGMKQARVVLLFKKGSKLDAGLLAFLRLCLKSWNELYMVN